MKIVKLKGGLGNQLFQYCFAKALCGYSNERVKLDLSSYTISSGDIIRKPRILQFDISLETARNEEIQSFLLFPHRGLPTSFLYKVGICAEAVFNKKYYLQRDRKDIDISLIPRHSYYDGYWQSLTYFQQNKDAILNEFRPRKPLNDSSQKVRNDMFNSNSVFVGVRRGDYLRETKHYGSFSPDYYRKGMEFIANNIENPVFYIFSNDIEWCRRNIAFDSFNIVYRDNEKQFSDFEELVLMSSCKHAIIVNSTYYWWGATLIMNEKKIVCCPDRWFFDVDDIKLFPSDWIKIK